MGRFPERDLFSATSRASDNVLQGVPQGEWTPPEITSTSNTVVIHLGVGCSHFMVLALVVGAKRRAPAVFSFAERGALVDPRILI